MTKLAATLPKGDKDGLASLARTLIDTPEQVHVVVMLIDCKSLQVDCETGDVQPTARIRRIEPIAGEDKELAAKMLRRAMEERTGQVVLPFDMEEDMRAVFSDIDPETGEVRGAEGDGPST